MVWVFKKRPCKRVLEKHFTKDIDYKSALPNSGERKNEGGFNKRIYINEYRNV
jgi:hypothetical protein